MARGGEEGPLATTRESYEHTLSISFPMYKRSRTRRTRGGRGSEWRRGGGECGEKKQRRMKRGVRIGENLSAHYMIATRSDELALLQGRERDAGRRSGESRRGTDRNTPLSAIHCTASWRMSHSGGLGRIWSSGASFANAWSCVLGESTRRQAQACQCSFVLYL